MLEAVLLHSENKQITHAWLMAVAQNGSTILSSVDIFVRELSEVTLICFMCVIAMSYLRCYLVSVLGCGQTLLLCLCASLL